MSDKYRVPDNIYNALAGPPKVMGMDPAVNSLRLSLLPRYSQGNGLVMPQVLYDMARAFQAPVNALRGHATTPEEALNFAGNLNLGAIGASALAPAKGYGRTVGIVSPARARSLPYAHALPDHPEFAQAVANTPGAQVTEDGLLMRVARRQAPEVEGEQAIRTGVFYLPEGSSNLKHYGGYPQKTYGGSEKFSGETLVKKPLFVKGGTGGKAPEAAYDQLLGKGAYQNMRNDVLRHGPGYSLSHDLKVERVAELLAKYGGDPNLADTIVRSSTKGNTLPYAIQEHVVAHAVRNAGYDAVLGYSKGKAGPFLSELFDVREQTYPSHVMPTQIHEAFEK